MVKNNTIVINKNNTSVLDLFNILVFNSDMNFSERVKYARKHAKLSQDELAYAVGCTQGLISKIERGDQNESALIVKIAKALKVSVDWLDTGEGDMLQTHSLYQTTSPEAKVLELMQQMDEATKYQAVKIIDTLAEPKKLEGTNGGQ